VICHVNTFPNRKVKSGVWVVMEIEFEANTSGDVGRYIATQPYL